MTRSPAVFENREGLEDYAVRWGWVTGTSASGFTAVLRVKDEARSIPWVLPPILRSVERAVVVDNGSTDGTPEVARRAAEGAGLGERLEVLSYPFPVSRCGPEHLATPPDSVRSLTYFYNWSFSHVRTRYALKWDGDMVLTPQGERVLRDLAWQLEGVEAILRMRRAAVYVESASVAYVDLAYSHGELWGWPNTPNQTFIKCFDWEFIQPFADHLIELPDVMCFELKWLDADEFAHWSNTGFDKANLNARKRRDLKIFRALHEGFSLPDNVVRVESPEGVHVVEHLRQVYAVLRLEGKIGPVPGGAVEDVRVPSVNGRAGETAMVRTQNGEVRHG